MKNRVSLLIALLILSYFLGYLTCWRLHREGAPRPQAKLTFTFDDNYESHYSLALPVLKERGIPATIYVISDYVGVGGQIGWGELLELQNVYGWEVGSQSRTHKDLTRVDLETLVDEVETSKKILESHGLFVRSFAAPYGALNATVKAYAAKYYSSVRGVGGFNDLNVDPYSLLAMTIESDTKVETVKGWIDEAISKNKWLILLFHEIIHGTPKSRYQYSLAGLKAVIDYAVKKEIKIVNVSEGVALVKSNLIPNFSFESRADSWPDGWARNDQEAVTLDLTGMGCAPYPTASIKFAVGPQAGKLISSKVAVDPSLSYSGRVFVNIIEYSSGGLSLWIEEYDVGGWYLGGRQVGSINGKGVGFLISFVYEPSSERVVVVDLQICSEPGSFFKAYVDNIEFGESLE